MKKTSKDERNDDLRPEYDFGLLLKRGVHGKYAERLREGTTRQATCSCGKLTVTTHGEPVRVSVCHCPACQRRTGSIFGAQARFPSGNVKISGESKVYVRTADSGNQIHFHFCPACGATVYYQFGNDPDVIGVPVGAFADPEFPPPRVSVYESSRHRWASLPKDIEHIE